VHGCSATVQGASLRRRDAQKALKGDFRFGTGLAMRWFMTTSGVDVANYLSEGANMLSWALTFLVFALIAGLLGFTSVAGASISVAKILFFVFLILFLISAIRGRSIKA
jgi:uncharacterized membrane protein YtjA (UPF0391 family)